MGLDVAWLDVNLTGWVFCPSGSSKTSWSRRLEISLDKMGLDVRVEVVIVGLGLGGITDGSCRGWVVILGRLVDSVVVVLVDVCRRGGMNGGRVPGCSRSA